MADNPEPQSRDIGEPIVWTEKDLELMTGFTAMQIAAIMARLQSRNPELYKLVTAANGEETNENE